MNKQCQSCTDGFPTECTCVDEIVEEWHHRWCNCDKKTCMVRYDFSKTLKQALQQQEEKHKEELKQAYNEGITSLKRIQSNLPLTDPIAQNRKKMDFEIKRLQTYKDNL